MPGCNKESFDHDELAFSRIQASWSHPLLGLDDDDELTWKHRALSFMRATECLVLAGTITGIIFCPCMARVFWWENEIEGSKNRLGSYGLSWCLSLGHLDHFYCLNADKCNIVELFILCCAVCPHGNHWCQAEWVELGTTDLAKPPLRSFDRWRSFATYQR